ncbi:MAG: ABC transporter permease [Planctomycetes bacterium]|nr:ABC transporter permease [Planctomycetota bacterium]
MGVFVRVYRRLDQLQGKLWFRTVASVLAILVIGGFYGPLLVVSYDLDAQRNALGRALVGQNLNQADEHAVSLAETGTITVNGRMYGGPEFLEQADLLFDGQGEILSPAGLARQFVSEQEPAWAPRFLLEQPGTTWMLAIVTTLWVLLIVWMQITLPFVLTVLGTAAPVAVCWALGAEPAMLAIAGMGLLTFTFVLLTRAVLILFAYPHQVLAIAHTVMKEASRTRLSLVFVIGLLILLPLLPIWLDPEAPLRFRIQTFISRSLSLTYALAACMTLFLSCATVAFEIRDRQIWQLMTKPVTRLNYLLGKWLGVLSVNVVILLVAGVSIFTYVKYLSQLPVASGLEGALDRLAVRDEVLTARVGTMPQFELLSPQQLSARVEQLIDRDPELAGQEEISLSVKRKLAADLQENHLAAQRSILPMMQRSYTFEGLRRARNLQSTLTLRYRFHILRDDEHQTFPVAFTFNDRPDTLVRRQYVPTVTHILPIGTDLIRDDGTMSVTVYNLNPPQPGRPAYGFLNFEADDFELLYKVGSFEANFFRAVLMTWVKLAFLAMLGIACSTLLSFPVACMLSFTIFLGGTLGPFLALSLHEYYPPLVSQMDWSNIGMVIRWAAQSLIRAIAQGLVFLLHSFGEYRPTQSLVEGRLIPWTSVAGVTLSLGLMWSSIALVFGYLVMRNRQLAIYSGHG